MPYDKLQKVVAKIVDYVEEFMKITLCETKMKLFEKKKTEAQNLLKELEKPEVPQISQQDRDKNLEEVLALYDQDQITQKVKNIRSKKH
ncbi:MAG: hypothetical protein L6V95_15295 [Candidatus Melainabacteria bacterium]|nr:MAG: hypothetical protein L6V95_15295 [Candidatus Melainabacteria bacterium]